MKSLVYMQSSRLEGVFEDGWMDYLVKPCSVTVPGVALFCDTVSTSFSTVLQSYQDNERLKRRG